MCTHDVGNSAEIREITKNVKRFREISDDTERLHAPVERFREISDDTERLHAPVKQFREISDDTERLHAPVKRFMEISDDTERLHAPVKRFREISDDTERLHAPVKRFREISDDTERLHAPVKRFREISDDISWMALLLSLTRILPEWVQQSRIFVCFLRSRALKAIVARFAVRSSLMNKRSCCRFPSLWPFSEVRARYTESRTLSDTNRTMTARGRSCPDTTRPRR